MVIYVAWFFIGVFVGNTAFWYFRVRPLEKALDEIVDGASKLAEQNLRLIKLSLGIPAFEKQDGKFISPIQPHGNH